MTTSQNASTLRDEIIAEALSWQGTPYRHQASCKGAGCDCLGLIRGVYRHFWDEPETPPPYSPDWAETNGRETLALAATRYLISVEKEDRAPGDVLLFRYKKGFPAKHAGILINSTQFLHAQHGGNVSVASLGPLVAAPSRLCLRFSSQSFLTP
ncbi:NlpC/P60 family protein [uncultured Cohaesibacter sp.]|uniref:NlpC/P60 family protein n=1 Tax=uncultured Cohaesibacter sp. TaxID=1002546 RepID=UPI0029C6F458|nr:NlpC/P60 family protein [uncultured Cohaesibacter sp.]